ncbi:MAG TPA: response regulator transcription factor [Chloroflexota bacterium]|nr:response regulator transcription factor [Chloroflexota bacterium]
MIRVLLLEDHASFRQALALIIEREPDFSVVAQAGSLAEARALLPQDVDVAVVDLSLPDGEGRTVITALHRASPRTRVLVLTASLDPVQRAQAVEAGAAGVLHKAAALDEIVSAVRRLGAGEWLFAPHELVEMLRFVSRHRDQQREATLLLQQLTPREREVLQALAAGLDSKQIAQRLYITVETECTHMVNILSKLGVHSRLQALVFALRHGAVAIPPAVYQA